MVLQGAATTFILDTCCVFTLYILTPCLIKCYLVTNQLAAVKGSSLVVVLLLQTSAPPWFCVFVCPQCWEYGIPLCRELAFQYESLYDYQSLSWIRVSPNNTYIKNRLDLSYDKEILIIRSHNLPPATFTCRKWRRPITTTSWSSSAWSPSSSGSASTAGSSLSSSE